LNLVNYKFSNSIIAPILLYLKFIGRGAPSGKGRDHPSRQANIFSIYKHSNYYNSIKSILYMLDN